jgi:protoheme ferro-lyase
VNSLRWLLVAVLCLLLGIALVRFLTVHPLQMSLYLFFTCLFLFVTIALLGLSFRGKELWGALALAITLFVAGYSLMTWRVLSREDSRPLPAITRATGDPGDGHTAIVYLTHGEPETYDPIGWLNTFREIDETGVKFVPVLARPMFLTQLRKAYLRVGASQHVRVHQQMAKSLEQAYRDQGDGTTQVYVSFLDADPRPDAAAIRALNEGASKIIVMLVFVSVSNHTAEGTEMIKELGVEDYGAELKFAGPLWDSRSLQGMFLQRANAAIGDADKSKVGVLMVGHGQPDEWDRQFPTETEHEIAFRMGALKLFEQDGYRPENLSLAWMEFRQPHPAEKVEEFARNGVNRVVYFAAAISADSIHSQNDIPELVHKATVPAGFVSTNLGAWNDDPIVIKAIKEKIDEHMK